MSLRRSALFCFAMIIAAPAFVSAATPMKIESAIHRAVSFLYAQQNSSGNWENSQTAPPHKDEGAGVDDGQWGGRTALVTYALLAAGERPLDPRILKATSWLRKANIEGNYALGMRANVWLNLPASAENLAALAADGRKLVANIAPPNSPYAGFYSYAGWFKANRFDMSVSQYGVLGMWAVAQRNQASVNRKFWELVEKSWQRKQLSDGGWAYYGDPRDKFTTSLPMTAAGVATLFITQEYLQADTGLDGERGNIVDPFIRRGVDFIAAKYPALLASSINTYSMYGVERVGVAGGYKYLGNVDWFAVGADVLVRRLQADGSFHDDNFDSSCSTSFVLLFLSRGRAPVMMNKLQYTITQANGPTEAHWNQRPRDVANVTHWVDTKVERHLNWQILDIQHATIDDLHDSNLLWISGNQSLGFTSEQKSLLKQYVEEGGLIVGNADAGNGAFNRSFKELGQSLFPDYAFSPLDEKNPSPLMNGEQFPAARWTTKARIEALGNGARFFMILLPDMDAGKAFQRRDAVKVQPFQFFSNLFLYSIDKTDARFKGDTHVVRPDPAKATTRTIPVARLKYSGRWDPEPAGWRRLAAVLQRRDAVSLQVKPVELGVDSLDEYKIAHLTGTEAFQLSPSQRIALQKFVARGGLLVVDACGGLANFNASAQTELSQIFADGIVQLASPLKDSDPLYTHDNPSGLSPKYRAYTILMRPAGASHFRLNGIRFGNRLGVIYSSDDLSEGLVGQSVDGIIGYQPDIATELMRRIVTLADAGKI